MSDGVKERPPMAFTTKGLMHLRRTVVLVIPYRFASPQSPTPFHQASQVSFGEITQQAAIGHRSHASENPLLWISN